MKEYIFQMQEFQVYHRDSAMKVGTDSLLLGAWCPLKGSEQYILDIGSGCGILSLMIAQRAKHANVYGVEVDEASFYESIHNLQQSPWSQRMQMYNMDIRQYQPEVLFDLIISNPPFYGSLLPFTPERTRARHQSSLDSLELLKSVHALLRHKGSFCMVLPFDQLDSFSRIALKHQLHVNQIVEVRHLPSSVPSRVLLKFAKEQTDVDHQNLTIGDTDCRTEAYESLLSPFLVRGKIKKATRK
ncbi:MAG: methyltransferase [Saprospiraceae bacterium]|nr:methyltransferase [Saprospiraceae bacterium]